MTVQVKQRRLPEYSLGGRPRRFCNFDRLLWALEKRGVTDGLVITLRPNVFYLSGFASRPSSSTHETNGYGVVFISPRRPDQPIVLVPDLELSYFRANPTWIEDVRVYSNMTLPVRMPTDAAAFARFVPSDVRNTAMGRNALATYQDGFMTACRRAMADLGMSSGKIGFDDLRMAKALAPQGADVVDAYGLMKFVRHAKTPEELVMLRRAAEINEKATHRAVREWVPGMTWNEFQHMYHLKVVELGGFVHDPGAVIVANPRGAESVFYVDPGDQDFVIEPGMNLMLDCHGTFDQYCWDSGKTWVVEDRRSGNAALVQRASTEAMRAVQAAFAPGVSLGELQEIGLGVFEKLRVPDAARASLFFHGLGLEHGDVEVLSAAGRPNWKLEEGMVVSTHVVYPGDMNIRYYLEDNAIVGPTGGSSLYEWGLEPFTN